jgi:hypothetical protein
LQWRYYDAATSLLVDSDDMITTGYSGVGNTRTGAYDPNASGNNIIRATLGADPTAVCATGNLGHVGTFRAKARAYFTSFARNAKVRLSWQEGDGPFRANPWAPLPATSGITGTWAELDLGLITIPPAQLGTQRWQGRIEAYTTGHVGSDTIDIDYLVLVPAGEGYGKARSAFAYDIGSLVASDDGTNKSGGTALNGQSAVLGGAWASSGGASDFVYTASGGGIVIRRSATTNDNNFAVLPTVYTSARVAADFRLSAMNVSYVGLLARYTDSSNHLRMRLDPTPTAMNIFVEAVVTGTPATIGTLVLWDDLVVDTWYRMELQTYPTGAVYVRLLDANGGTITSDMYMDSRLATGGTLASGKSGFFDLHPNTSAANRDFDNFVAAVPDPEPIVLYSGRTAEIRSDGAIRQDSTGTYYGSVPSYRGSRFLVPPAGDENRTSRILAKVHRNDIETTASANVTDNLTIQAVVTPRYLVAPF